MSYRYPNSHSLPVSRIRFLFLIRRQYVVYEHLSAIISFDFHRPQSDRVESGQKSSTYRELVSSTCPVENEIEKATR